MKVRVIEFKTEYRVGKDPFDKVLIAPSGPAFEKTRTWHRIKDINPELWPADKQEGMSFAVAKARWEDIAPAYHAWKSGQDLPEHGTPLEVWSGVTSDQARALKQMGIRTVEDVRDMGDAAMRELRLPNARQLPKMAASYLEGSDIAAKDAQIAEMQERMAAMEELLNEKSEDKPKRGPGRPKKTEEAA